jgi:transposase
MQRTTRSGPKRLRFSVRGLRRCQNENCAAHRNRDYNAAVNIQRRCKAMMSSTFRMTLDSTDAVFERLNDAALADG